MADPGGARRIIPRGKSWEASSSSWWTWTRGDEAARVADRALVAVER